MIVLDEERRGEIPVLNKPINQDVLNELHRLYPGYELVFRADIREWVLYHIKEPGGCPSDDLLFKQFILPGEPGMWLIHFMQEKDRGNETFREWLERARQQQHRTQESKYNRIQHIVEELYNDKKAYLDRGKATLHVHR